MKNLLKASLILMFPFVLSSCSKSDDEKPQNAKEAIIKVEVTNNQSSNFSEFLNIQVVSNNIGSTDVTGVTWDDKQSPSANTKWFVKQGDIKPTIVYQTTNKVTSLTYAVVITSKLATTTPLITTFKFYADDKLIKTETATTLDKATNVTIPIVVTDL